LQHEFSSECTPGACARRACEERHDATPSDRRFPFPQQPAPFELPVSSDAGYWFAFDAAGWYVVSVLRVHPSANAIDRATGVAPCADPAWQLRHAAEARQADDVDLALRHKSGAAAVPLHRRAA
jgi:hypothetical protein